LENAASQVGERFLAYFAAHDWDAMADLFADSYTQDDRRPTVNSGVRYGRDNAINDIRAVVDVGLWANLSSAVIATRGERLALNDLRASAYDPEAAKLDVLQLIEVDGDERFVACVVFDRDDIDTAFEELDARYLAGEAAVHAHTWSLIRQAYAAFNRRELAPTTPDWVNIDHRRGIGSAAGDMQAYVRTAWAVASDISTRIEAVHRLSDLGAVFTHTEIGTTHEGFTAEWREVALLTVDGDLINRCEVFDEADLDAALAKFDELCCTPTYLANAASEVFDSFRTCFAARDWAAMAEILAEDICTDDRRRVVGTEVLRGRNIDVAHMRAIADVGAQTIASTVIATRGDRLVLCRIFFCGEDQRPDAFHAEILGIVEIDSDERIVARLTFDPDDIDAAFTELDSRYAAGEAAVHSEAWSVLTQAYAALNRHELPATTPDWVNIDQRRGASFAPGETFAYLGATWDLMPDYTMRLAAVHRLSSLGAVVTHSAYGISQAGFDAEWRLVALFTFDRDLINRCELFDESDLDAAVAKFDELSRPTPHLNNAASRMDDRFWSYFAARDWAATAEILADDISSDDRRRVVNVGPRQGRDAVLAEASATAEAGVENVTYAVIATRGERLVVSRVHLSVRDQRSGAYYVEVLLLVEIDANQRIAARVVFDADDLDAAFAELDARYLAGEAATHAHSWSVIAHAYAGLNRHEMYPTTPDWVNIDHRRALAFAPGDLIAYVRASWIQMPDMSHRIEAVHRLSDLGSVYTEVLKGNSQQGFDADWRLVQLMMVEGDLIDRAEIFDEADLDAAVAKFDELNRPKPRLENTASQVCERFRACFAARDWDAMSEMLADDEFNEDRRRVVNAGIRHGRGMMEDLRAAAEMGVTYLTADVIATRGERLVLIRGDAGNKERPGEFQWDLLQVAEIDADEQLAVLITFDVDHMDAAFAELDARYLAGEAATHAHTWSVVAKAYDAFNQHAVAPTTPDWAYVDNRHLVSHETADPAGYAHALWDVTPDIKSYIAAVHRLSDFGAVITHATYGTSREGFDGEWRMIAVTTIDGDLFTRYEIFDEADLDSALARFDELNALATHLDNAATRIRARLADAFNRRDVDGFLAIGAGEGGRIEDRRKGLRALFEGTDRLKAIHEYFDAPPEWQLESLPLAVRGSRLSLMHDMYRDSSLADRPITIELLTLLELGDDDRAGSSVAFDVDDIDAAFEELETRYLAGEAVPYSHTWSVIARGYASFNRRELPPTKPNWVNIDHRHVTTIAPGELFENVRASWDLAPDVRNRIEVVHRLSGLGAVVTRVSSGTSQDGFDAEWRSVNLVTVDGELLSRLELFDEADLDTALARFDELNASPRLFENAAARAWMKVVDAFNSRDLDAVLNVTTADGRVVDRRKGLGAVHEGAERVKAAHALFVVPESWRTDIRVLASRGSILALIHQVYRDTAEAGHPVAVELFTIVEGDGGLVGDVVNFDIDDFDAAVEELDARYIAGEAAAHANTWSVIADGYVAFNRRELPPFSPDYVSVDHRRGGSAFAPGEHVPYIQATWDVAQQVNAYVEVVHHLTTLGAIVTQAVKATSQVGFYAEWREICLATVEGDFVNRIELFDETDLDTALARFDELSASTQLKNGATQARRRVADAINRRDLDAMLALAVTDARYDDRRKGLRDDGRAWQPNVVRALLEATEGMRLDAEPIAVRGSRLGLTRDTYREINDDRTITGEHLTLTEIGDDELIYNSVLFDPDDINGAMAELTSRWIASGEVAHPEIIKAAGHLVEIGNRHDWNALADRISDATFVNHRQLAAGDDTIVEYISSIRTIASLVPDVSFELTEIPAHSASGLVARMVLKGTSTGGVEFELPIVAITLLDGERITHLENFDLEQRDLALARFAELNRPA
jgi:hypothetical protein